MEHAHSVSGGQLVKQAAAGSREAWESLVDAYGGLVWSVARREVPSASDAADVSQTTWLRLYEHIDRLTEPDRVSSWLATTARREGRRVAARGRRTVALEDSRVPEQARHAEDDVDVGLLRAESVGALQAAIEELPARSQHLMRLLIQEPPLPYTTISALMDMPVGSIGPTRARCLRKLRALMGPQHSNRA
jgi:RNA polymerase sigma factor (sigma-70 family)